MISSAAEPAPIKGVIFDFHATLVDAQDTAGWVDDAHRRLARPADRPEPDAGPALATSVAPDPSVAPVAPDREGLSEYLYRIWEHATAIDPNSERDLSPVRHRDVFTRTVGLRTGVDPELIDALYAVMPDQWIAFDDALPVLRELKARGLRIVVLSNIGMDIRGCLDRTGLADLIDGLVLSYEVGVVKPEPGIFAHALELLGLPASQVLMVGDSWRDDAGAAALGIRTLILPRTVGPVHGLDAVLRLVG